MLGSKRFTVQRKTCVCVPPIFILQHFPQCFTIVVPKNYPFSPGDFVFFFFPGLLSQTTSLGFNRFSMTKHIQFYNENLWQKSKLQMTSQELVYNIKDKTPIQGDEQNLALYFF